MNMSLIKKIKKVTALLLIFSYIFTSLPNIPQASGQVLNVQVVKASSFVPSPVIKGIQVYPDQPFVFDFFMDPGSATVSDPALNDQALKLIKYFMASLTIPEDNLWVNLSPYDADRIIPAEFGLTDMGKDLLIQDYFLKQFTSNLMNPKNTLGKKFWDKVYHRAYQTYGHDFNNHLGNDLRFDLLNKIWIVPEQADVYIDGQKAFVVSAKLKVLLEEDYKGLRNKGVQKYESQDVSTSDLIRQVFIPEIEREVNEGKGFAILRQMYHALILATWYKRHLKNSLLHQVYVEQKRVDGIDLEDKNMKEQVYEDYLRSFREGVFNFIQEDYDPLTQQLIPRKYFSGGAGLYEIRKVYREVPHGGIDWLKEAVRVSWKIVAEQSTRARGGWTRLHDRLKSGQLRLRARSLKVGALLSALMIGNTLLSSEPLAANYEHNAENLTIMMEGETLGDVTVALRRAANIAGNESSTFFGSHSIWSGPVDAVRASFQGENSERPLAGDKVVLSLDQHQITEATLQVLRSQSLSADVEPVIDKTVDSEDTEESLRIPADIWKHYHVHAIEALFGAVDVSTGVKKSSFTYKHPNGMRVGSPFTYSEKVDDWFQVSNDALYAAGKEILEVRGILDLTQIEAREAIRELLDPLKGYNGAEYLNDQYMEYTTDQLMNLYIIPNLLAQLEQNPLMEMFFGEPHYLSNQHAWAFGGKHEEHDHPIIVFESIGQFKELVKKKKDEGGGNFIVQMQLPNLLRFLDNMEKQEITISQVNGEVEDVGEVAEDLPGEDIRSQKPIVQQLEPSKVLKKEKPRQAPDESKLDLPPPRSPQNLKRVGKGEEVQTILTQTPVGFRALLAYDWSKDEEEGGAPALDDFYKTKSSELTPEFAGYVTAILDRPDLWPLMFKQMKVDFKDQLFSLNPAMSPEETVRGLCGISMAEEDVAYIEHALERLDETQPPSFLTSNLFGAGLPAAALALLTLFGFVRNKSRPHHHHHHDDHAAHNHSGHQHHVAHGHSGHHHHDDEEHKGHNHSHGGCSGGHCHGSSLQIKKPDYDHEVLTEFFEKHPGGAYIFLRIATDLLRYEGGHHHDHGLIVSPSALFEGLIESIQGMFAQQGPKKDVLAGYSEEAVFETLLSNPRAFFERYKNMSQNDRFQVIDDMVEVLATSIEHVENDDVTWMDHMPRNIQVLKTTAQSLLNQDPSFWRKIQLRLIDGHLNNLFKKITSHGTHDNNQIHWGAIGLGVLFSAVIFYFSPEFEPVRDFLYSFTLPDMSDFEEHGIGSLSIWALATLYLSNIINPLFFTFQNLKGYFPNLLKRLNILVQFDWATDYILVLFVAASAAFLSISYYAWLPLLAGLTVASWWHREHIKSLPYIMMSWILISHIIAADIPSVIASVQSLTFEMPPAISTFLNLSIIHILFDVYLGQMIGDFSSWLGISASKGREKTLAVIAGLTATTSALGLTYVMIQFGALGVVGVGFALMFYYFGNNFIVQQQQKQLMRQNNGIALNDDNDPEPSPGSPGSSIKPALLPAGEGAGAPGGVDLNMEDVAINVLPADGHAVSGGPMVDPILLSPNCRFTPQILSIGHVTY
jgi:hypothetical protein